MPNEYRFTCPLPCGMHARPASALEHVSRRFTCEVKLLNARSGQSANAKSVLGIVGLDIRLGDPCRLATSGPDARWAIDSLRIFVEQTLPHLDDAPPAVEREPGTVDLPPVLRDAGAVVMPGTPAAPGIALGRAVAVAGFTIPASIPLTGPADIDVEVHGVEQAFDRMLQRYDERIGAGDGHVETDVLKAHRSVARDPGFVQAIIDTLRAGGRTAAGAIVEAEAYFGARLAETGSALLRERVLDIRDVCRELLTEVYGPALGEGHTVLTVDSVCLADTLTPGQFLSLDRRWLRGLVLAHGGTTSHTVILARSHGVPTVVGVAGIDVHALAGQDVVVDADLGVVVSNLTGAARRYYDMERRRLERRRERVRRFAERPAATEDGVRLEVAANVGSASEVADAVAQGAEGVGLFRTEMLFLARKDAPGEDEQFDEYRRALAACGGRAVIVRTLDVGGDKPLPYLSLPREDNPFLGYRAVRIYREFDALFRTQVRALVRASAHGPLRMMVPMVASIDDVRWVRAVVAEEQARLQAAAVPYDPLMRLGAMIEVPAAAFMMAELSQELDFFSIGTNDLLQYFLAADRTNPRVAGLARPFEPSFLRLLDRIVAEARAHGRWIGLCGELGGQARFLPLLVGLRLDEISMAAGEVAATKALLSSLSADKCRTLVEDALKATTADEVERRLDERGHWRAQPLMEPDLVALDVEAASKSEAIKGAVDLLYAAGRTDRPREVEQAVWVRERDYPTDVVGHGFAIPHCKGVPAVAANSLVVVRLREGVAWGPKSEQPVRTILLMATRPSDANEHLRVFAALARKLMHEDFRHEMDEAADPAAVCATLARAVSESGKG